MQSQRLARGPTPSRFTVISGIPGSICSPKRLAGSKYGNRPTCQGTIRKAVSLLPPRLKCLGASEICARRETSMNDMKLLAPTRISSPEVVYQNPHQQVYRQQ